MARTTQLDIKKGDTVYVLRGKDRAHRMEGREEELARLEPARLKREAEKDPGRRGKVIGVIRDKRQVLVDGINMITKHARPRGMTSRAAQMQTGRIQQPGPLHISNVMLVCPRCDRPAKVTRREVSGKRIRVCRRCSEYIDEV
ncbi:MAG: 50S ribosomal protein L24 [Armatimonadota bacterium]|nr:MAG: 50S ribosomal protein L24 [Armatimonadota bacterium]